MELMGDIGLADQLTSAREENKVLRAKVQELTEKVKDLTLTNAQLLAEVEMYRNENSLPSFSKLALGGGGGKASGDDNLQGNDMKDDENDHHFISSGDGTFASESVATFPGIHGLSTNPLCCALDETDTILATGGADGYVCIMRWGTALMPGENSSQRAMEEAALVKCTAPVICIGFASFKMRGWDVLAAGCLDGSVHLIAYNHKVVEEESFGQRRMIRGWILDVVGGEKIKFSKYVKCLAFAPDSNVLASASADGTILLTKIIATTTTRTMDDDDGYEDSVMMEEADDSVTTTTKTIILEQIKSIHLKGGVEALCFVNDGNTLCFYERDTSYLAYLDVQGEDFKITKHSLNGDVTGGFDNHVSFAVMHLALSPNGQYICAATDSSRNIIMQVQTSNIVRNLYGHKNDVYSQPRIAWSSNGQYILGNTQEDNSICVWDIASSKMVRKLEGHGGQIRDIFSSKVVDTVVTVSYDKSVKVWLCPM